MKSKVTNEKQGSALLIVLGLLSFLMISAVAFSISMRTERQAASAYRRGLLARELLENAFADARATVETALRYQQNNFDPDVESTRTVENLAPFRFPGEGNNTGGTDQHYGRMLVSHAADECKGNAASNYDVAYLLDEKVMRHVPPYVAYSVYKTLELDTPLVGDQSESSRYMHNSAVEWGVDVAACWKPILAKKQRFTSNNNNNTGSAEIDYNEEGVLGRMAWAVVNLSDSLDLNALGSAGTYRGIGLSGNDFVYRSTDSTDADERFDWIKEDADFADLPLFCSNGDIGRYAEMVDGDVLTLEDGGIYPYAWQSAVDEMGEGYFSPFSCYSFWPAATRKNESGERRDNKITCDKIATEGGDVTWENLFDGTGISNVNWDLLRRMFYDYLDKDSAPSEFGDMSKERQANVAPSVENAPMISEVGYKVELPDENKIGEQIEDGVKSVSNKYKNKPVELNAIATSLEGETLKVKIPKTTLECAIRTYLPGYEEITNSQSYDVGIEGFVGAIVTGKAKGGAGGEQMLRPKSGSGDFQLKASDPLEDSTSVNLGNLFSEAGSLKCETNDDDLEFEFDGASIPVNYTIDAGTMATSPVQNPDQEVTLYCLMDYFFKGVVRDNNSKLSDCVPANTKDKTFEAADYERMTGTNRFNKQYMVGMDGQYFRVSIPFSVTFKLEFKIVEENNTTNNTERKFKYEELTFAEGQEPRVTFCNEGESFTFEASTPKTLAWCKDATSSLEMVSSEEGVWYSIDPRYNWMSPMLGLASDDASAYGINSAIFKVISSPQWLFLEESVSSGGSIGAGNDATDVQKDYADKHANGGDAPIAPFMWGLNVEDVRYGYNDCGQLLLPGEIGFLPMPSQNISPNEDSYQRNTIQNYYDSVAKASFFRTLPIVNLKDDVFTDAEYEDYAQLCKTFEGMTQIEEHRSLVNVFAGQDNYELAQRMRQLALRGIPSTLRQAARITLDRLNQANEVKKVAPDVVADFEQNIANVVQDLPQPTEAKYDEFVTKYLFPLPKSDYYDWNADQVLYEGGTKDTPARPQTLANFLTQNASSSGSEDNGVTFADKFAAYNETKSSGDQLLGQNDMTLLASLARESFGDRQQLFLYILRADAIDYKPGRYLASSRPLSTARAVALVWRDAYGELPDRVIYYQVMP